MNWLTNSPVRNGAALVAVVGLGLGGAHLASSDQAARHHDRMMNNHVHDGAGHDEVTMPGLRGENASPQESAELEVLFRNFDTITREVENLPNGIRTVTRSSDQTVMDHLVNHAVGMIDRVGQMDDPKIRIQSPTLDIFFLRGDRILSYIEMTDDGLIITQTSEDPEIVAALQTHAAEVTAMSDHGMQAVHEMMMERGISH
ncbi:hypothetical protein L0666_03890 [Octadecabacter sp. CECT 8868]|uniref:hypothetical protein n=1 Tax=Octadecabacter algicola TaxID=2909342 RepID=UPI001F290704|nr:hypothetical protein [Octadecabacter algicola]MCF2904119.1 hypothetical protein [Octadecabacter algicola]